MAESRETVEAEADADAESPATESDVHGAEESSGEVVDSAASTAPISVGAAPSASKMQHQPQPQQQHLPR